MTELEQPVRVINEQQHTDQRFGEENLSKGRFRMLRSRLVSGHCPCSVDVHADQSEETEVGEKVQSEAMQSTGEERIVELNVQVEGAHPLSEAKERQQSVGKREKGQVGEGRVAAQCSLQENTDCHQIQEESEEEERIVVHEEKRASDRPVTRTRIAGRRQEILSIARVHLVGRKRH